MTWIILFLCCSMPYLWFKFMRVSKTTKRVILDSIETIFVIALSVGTVFCLLAVTVAMIRNA